MSLKMTEVFCGSGKMSRSFAKRGYNVYSIDNRRRKGICEPTLKSDIMQIKVQHTFFLSCDVLWFGLPCDVWSNASGNFHMDKNGFMFTAKAYKSYYMLLRVLDIIEKNKPVLWFIENPRGRLRYNKELRTFLKKNNGVVHDFSMGSFGFPSQKPTQLFTNFKDLKVPGLLPYGRGNKSNGNFDNLTKCQRQSYPLEFTNFIASECQKYSALN